MFMRHVVFLCMFAAVSAPALAAGPEAMAKSDRSLWPETLNSPEAYDRASRAEILVFTDALSQVSALDEAGLREEFHIKSADKASVTKVSNYFTGILLGNYHNAAKSCKDGEPFCENIQTTDALLSASHTFSEHVPAKYQAWLINARKFHHTYAVELMRLAALFPKTSSEIDVFNDNERNGFELPDGHFQLSFDDGPTVQGGNSDKLLGLLKEHHIHALFFMLGDKLEERLKTQGAEDLQKLYDGQCVALHGWHHNSHQKWDKWQESVLDTQSLVQKTFPGLYHPYFRPPYAQRRSDSGPFFKEHGLGVALWNIDTQDWSSKVDGDAAGNRAFTLMLLWRRGVFLFHDIHPKAQVAVPWLLQQTQGTGVVWNNCQDY